MKIDDVSISSLVMVEAPVAHLKDRQVLLNGPTLIFRNKRASSNTSAFAFTMKAFLFMLLD